MLRDSLKARHVTPKANGLFSFSCLSDIIITVLYVDSLVFLTTRDAWISIVPITDVSI